MKILVMGVSGCGKSSFGGALAQKLGLPFFDADDFHSPEAVAKMATGQPLSDEDRQPWLQRLAQLLSEQKTVVLACSALKKHYRDLLRQAAPTLCICYLQGDFVCILKRLEQRQKHEAHFFAGAQMLQSQFDSLEEPQEDEAPLLIPIEKSPEEQLRMACQRIRN